MMFELAIHRGYFKVALYVLDRRVFSLYIAPRRRIMAGLGRWQFDTDD